MERRIRPWINKKIIEYIGEEEATLVDFVCSKVRMRMMKKNKKSCTYQMYLYVRKRDIFRYFFLTMKPFSRISSAWLCEYCHVSEKWWCNVL